ncbi:MAG: electron transport complex subunit RsxG [Gammaproteobacteria bacterium]|nr:electron transport complex subunit RsxG [Gammaproteobacteria bacterium]
MKNSTILKSGALMLVFTLICVFFVSLAEQTTKEKIAFNEEQLLIKRLNEIVANYDNDIVSDQFERDIELHGIEQSIRIFPAEIEGQVFAYLIEHIYPNGYNGNIRLLTGIDVDGELLGIRVIGHKETPGLGDKIETRKSDWIKSFSGLSLSNLSKSQWKVKRDGGSFDQFTGATITPRAIVSAAYQILEHFEQRPLDEIK